MGKLEDRLTNGILDRCDKMQGMVEKQISLVYPTLTRKYIEKMVKPLQWEDYNGEYDKIYAQSNYMGVLDFEIKSENRKTYWVGVYGTPTWLGSSVSKCKQQAQSMLVDIICSALGVEE